MWEDRGRIMGEICEDCGSIVGELWRIVTELLEDSGRIEEDRGRMMGGLWKDCGRSVGGRLWRSRERMVDWLREDDARIVRRLWEIVEGL